MDMGIPGGLPEGEQWTPHSEMPPPRPYPNKMNLINELLSKPDWQPYKSMPFKERRSGQDRRKVKKVVARDRRSGQDRRKSQNLFKEREDFVQNWNQEVQQKIQEIARNAPPQYSNPVQAPPADWDENKNPFTPESLLGVPSEPPPIPNFIPVVLPEPVPIDPSSLPKPVDQDQVQNATPPPPNKDLREEVEQHPPANEEYIRYSPEIILPKINLPDPEIIPQEDFEEAPKRQIIIGSPEDDIEGIEEPEDILFPTLMDEKVRELFKIDLPAPKDKRFGEEDEEEDEFDPDIETPDIEPIGDIDVPEIEVPEEPEEEKMIHGILELKPPEVDDAPFLTLTYDFTKIPHSFRLSKNYSLMEYSYYKYKPMLMKAQEFARRKMLKNAISYYRVIKAQNIPPELKIMINRNIIDITEFLEKFLMSKGGG